MKISPAFAAVIGLICVGAFFGSCALHGTIKENEAEYAKMRAQEALKREVYRTALQQSYRELYETQLRWGVAPAKAKEDLEKALAELDKTHPPLQ